jgi:hypothetical protein
MGGKDLLRFSHSSHRACRTLESIGSSHVASSQVASSQVASSHVALAQVALSHVVPSRLQLRPCEGLRNVLEVQGTRTLHEIGLCLLRMPKDNLYAVFGFRSACLNHPGRSLVVESQRLYVFVLPLGLAWISSMVASNLVLLLQLQATRELHRPLYYGPRVTMLDITRTISRMSHTFSLWPVLLTSALLVSSFICMSIVRIED